MKEMKDPGVDASPRPFILPAQNQTSIPTEELLHSASAGLIVRRTAQLRGRFRSEGRQFARELAEHVNKAQRGVATVFLFEETFGVKDRIHWFIHMNSIDDYQVMAAMGATDEEFRNLIFKERIAPEKGGGGWDAMFLDGSLRETVLIPHHWRIYGTESKWSKPTPRTPDGWSFVAPAQHQTTLPLEQTLNTANSAAVVHRSGQLKHEFRSEGRRVARELMEYINTRLVGRATIFLFEEAFGIQDRIHWLIHMDSLNDYKNLLELWDEDDEFRSIALRDRIPSEIGGGSWEKMFIDGSLRETALTPQQWGLYATQR